MLPAEPSWAILPNAAPRCPMAPNCDRARRNLAGRWDARNLALIDTMDCDVLLLTEVSERVELPGHGLHLGGPSMMPKRRWAAVASRQPLRPMPDPHGASAMAELGGLLVCSSILPWRSCGTQDPWAGATTAEKTIDAVAAVEAVARREPALRPRRVRGPSRQCSTDD